MYELLLYDDLYPVSNLSCFLIQLKINGALFTGLNMNVYYLYEFLCEL